MVYMVVELCSLARRQPRTVKDQLDIVASPMIGIISSNWLETTRIVRWPPASKYETSLQNESSLKYHWKMYEISTVLADNIVHREAAQAELNLRCVHHNETKATAVAARSTYTAPRYYENMDWHNEIVKVMDRYTPCLPIVRSYDENQNVTEEAPNEYTQVRTKKMRAREFKESTVIDLVHNKAPPTSASSTLHASVGTQTDAYPNNFPVFFGYK